MSLLKDTWKGAGLMRLAVVPPTQNNDLQVTLGFGAYLKASYTGLIFGE